MALLLPLPAPAAIDMFLDLDGIPGESNDASHADNIDVLSWSMGVTNVNDRASFQDLVVIKWVDKATPPLMLKASNGTPIDQATLTMRKAGENPLEYLIITMTDVVVTRVSTGGSGGEDRLTEKVTFRVNGSIEVRYRELLHDGTAGSPIIFSYDFKSPPI